MNGNQGLEALASLCGGVSKARTSNENSQQKQNPNNDESSMMPPPTGHLMHPNVMNLQNHAISNKSQLSQQQLYAVLSAANGSSNVSPFSLSNANFHQRSLQNSDSNANGAAQQLAYYNHLYNAQVVAAAQQAMQLNSTNQNQQKNNVFEGGHSSVEQQIAAALALASGSGTTLPQMRLQEQSENSRSFHSQQVQQNGISSSRPEGDAQRDIQSNNSNQQQPQNISQVAAPAAVATQKLAFGGTQSLQQDHVTTHGQAEDAFTLDDRKQVKRAANRRSAQLSRKRKKQFIEELKEENDDLRRKEQILRSIPDLVVVFDSAGKLGFVSQSVSRFLAFTSDALEGTSFWNRLCDESVRLLKAAFMDALAARKAGMDTAPLGDGLWELRLVDKDGKHKIVILNGVVHFTGETPECVCSIRPTDDSSVQYLKVSTSISVKSPSVSASQYIAPRDTIHPQQSVKSTGPTEDSPVVTSKIKPRGFNKSKGTTRINPVSDGESVISENASVSS